MCKCCGDNKCKIIDQCCGKRKVKTNNLSGVLQHRPVERVIERTVVQIADKCPPDCDCGGKHVRDETV